MNSDKKQQEAAVKIQSLWRGYICRTIIQNKLRFNKAALSIQMFFRFYRRKIVVQSLSETISTAKITKAVKNVRLKKKMRKEIDGLKKNDHLLSFYPSRSVNNPNAKPQLLFSAKSKNRNKTELIRKPEKVSKSTPKLKEKRPLSQSRTTNTSVKHIVPVGSKTPLKRKTIISLPPPWKDKDPKRLSQSQMDDLLFQQKGNVSWAKKDLIPMLLRRCNPTLEERDSLFTKNEKFMNRSVQKPFVYLIQREDHFTWSHFIRSITRIDNTLTTVVVTAKDIIFYNVVSSVDDKHVVTNRMYGQLNSLISIIVNPSNGNIFGIDSRWNLFLLNGSNIVLKRALEVDKKIPLGRNYLFFDRFGMLWVNLLNQGGNLLCVDPLTFETAIRINYNIASKLHRYLNKCYQIFPIFFNSKWIGFAGSFTGEGVFLYNCDFNSTFTIKSSKLDKNCKIKQIGNRLLVWSPRNFITIYELFDDIFKTKFIGYINVKERIVSVEGAIEPDIIVVATKNKLLVYLSKNVEQLLTLPSANMSERERRFAGRLLGPPKVTQSRKAFTLLYKTTTFENINYMSLSPISPKLCFVGLSSGNGLVTSFLLSYENIHVEAKNFDTMDFKDATMQSNLAVTNFFSHQDELTANSEKIVKEYRINLIFDARIVAGELSALFLDKKDKFSLINTIKKYSLKSNTFLPNVPPKTLSFYEVFHFLRRADILPEPISTFSEFLKRFTDTKISNDSNGGYLCVEKTIKSHTTGCYNAITDQFLTYDEVNQIIDKMNPIKQLNRYCPGITISSLDITTKKRVSLGEQIYKEYQRHELNKRISRLTKLEDKVKHEILRRLLDKTNEKVMNQRIIDPDEEEPNPEAAKKTAKKNVSSKDVSLIDFYPTPNRNPLLDEIRHKSIYESWAEKSMFGINQESRTYLQKLILPREYLDNDNVYNHFRFVQKFSQESRRIVSSMVYNYTTDIKMKKTHIVITQNNSALPLSHYLTIHSFLGSSWSELVVLRSILTKVLLALKKLHENNVICRTIHPSNIFLDPASNSITIGSIYDCQHNLSNGKVQALPLPPNFAQPSNPFLPPEYYHQPFSLHTPAFDVWQFGVLFLYMLTGSMPPSYGTELFSRLNEHETSKKVRFSSKNFCTQPPTYHDIGFFYDWMKGVTIVPPSERCIGECGESFFVSDTGKPGTSLDINSYKVLPFILKDKTDESHLIIDVIALCLELDPKKRPTVDQLLKLPLFAMVGLSSESLEDYMTSPDPPIFVSQFFTPVLESLSTKNFNFAMGIITSLIFSDNLSSDEIAYSFPLQKATTLKVIDALFQIDFIDTIITFLINTMSKEITKDDVAYGSTYSNDMFNSVFKFFDKFLKTVEHGQGPLMAYVNDIVQSLYGLYACNPLLMHECSLQLLESNEYCRDSCCLYIFMHNHLTNLVLFAAQGSSYIANRIKKTGEHNDAYFEQFINFANSVYSLAYSIVFGNDKQKSNNIKTVVSFWNGGQSLPIARLFVDFKVVQKIMQCITSPSVRTDATSFFITVAKVFRTKEGIMPFNWLFNSIRTPIVRVACNSVLRDPKSTDGMKQPVIEVLKHMMSFRTEHDLISMFTSDIFQYMCEQSNNFLFSTAIEYAIESSQPLLMNTLMLIPSITRTFSVVSIEYVPKIDLRVFNDALDINDLILLTKRLVIIFSIENSTISGDSISSRLPIEETKKFIVKTIEKLQNGAKELYTNDTKQMRRGKSKANKKEASQFSSHTKILFNLLFDLFKRLMKILKYNIPIQLFDFLLKNITAEVKHSVEGELPSVYAHICMQNMFLFTLDKLSKEKKGKKDFGEKEQKMIETFMDIIFGDMQWMISVTSDEIATHIVHGYKECKENRIRMVKYILKTGIKAEKLIKYIVHVMLHNTKSIKVQLWSTLRLKYEYPVRVEAVEMIAIILQSQGKYCKMIAEEIENSNFIENERKITDLEANKPLVSSSLRIFQSIINRNDLFSPHFIKQCQSMVESLNTRFHRNWIDMPFLEVLHQTMKQISKKNKSASYKADSWRRPITTLNGNPSALVFAPGSRPTTVLH